MTHLRRVPADDATITGWVSSILLLPPIFNLLLTLVKGRTTKELVLAEETENTEVYRERLRTTVVALDLDDGEITDIAA